MSANDKQVGGGHYRSPIQHWDYVVANRLDYFQGQITKYVTRWRDKGGLADLKKAQHFLEKYIELVEGGGDFYDQKVHAYIQEIVGARPAENGVCQRNLEEHNEGK
jgi:Protein of unknwon function (DUF3310)